MVVAERPVRARTEIDRDSVGIKRPTCERKRTTRSLSEAKTEGVFVMLLLLLLFLLILRLLILF